MGEFQQRVNIQSTAGTMHHMFGRINYKPWYAIAEFVDNSSQSFFTNKEKMKNMDFVTIKINYDNENSILTITDDAYGMDLKELIEALFVEGGKKEKIGRNEFGAGLKTAAGWFGNKWSIETIKYGSGKKYKTVVDIDNLENEIIIESDDVDVKLHGTVISIEKITKKLTASKTIDKIKRVLSSMYRRDISSGLVRLEYNGTPITFDPYPILNFRDTKWEKTVDFSFEFNGSSFRVNGFVAIMNPGSFSKAGLALFRRERVIIGGEDMNYKPSEIFGQSQSQVSLKLFGELNMDDFPVNQAKDGFVWDDGLEDAFLEALKENISDYIKIADISKKARDNEESYSENTSDKIQFEVRESLKKAFSHKNKKDENLYLNNILDKNSLLQYNKFLLEEDTIDDEKVVSNLRNYVIPLNDMENLNIDIVWTINHKKYWIDLMEEEQRLKININIDHPFFKPYSNNDEFRSVLEKFVIAFAVAEYMARKTSDKEGYIIYKLIRNYMNDYLTRMGG